MKMTVQEFKELAKKYACTEMTAGTLGPVIGFVFTSTSPVSEADKFLFDGVYRCHATLPRREFPEYYYEVLAPVGMSEKEIMEVLEG